MVLFLEWPLAAALIANTELNILSGKRISSKAFYSKNIILEAILSTLHVVIYLRTCWLSSIMVNPHNVRWWLQNHLSFCLSSLSLSLSVSVYVSNYSCCYLTYDLHLMTIFTAMSTIHSFLSIYLSNTNSLFLLSKLAYWLYHAQLYTASLTIKLDRGFSICWSSIYWGLSTYIWSTIFLQPLCFFINKVQSSLHAKLCCKSIHV